MKTKYFVSLVIGVIVGWSIYQIEHHVNSSQNEPPMTAKEKACSNMSVWHPDCKVE